LNELDEKKAKMVENIKKEAKSADMWHLEIKIKFPGDVYAISAAQLLRMQFIRRFGDTEKKHGVKWFVAPAGDTMLIDMYSKDKKELEVSKDIGKQIEQALKQQPFFLRLMAKKASSMTPEIKLEKL